MTVSFVCSRMCLVLCCYLLYCHMTISAHLKHTHMHAAACDGHMLEQRKTALSRTNTLHLLQQQNEWNLLRSGNFS